MSQTVTWLPKPQKHDFQAAEDYLSLIMPAKRAVEYRRRLAAAGEQVYQALLDAGVEVIVDDRTVRAGVKFSDAELVGIPFRVTVGKRGLAAGTVELTDRAAGSTAAIPLDEVAKHVREAVAGA